MAVPSRLAYGQLEGKRLPKRKVRVPPPGVSPPTRRMKGPSPDQPYLADRFFEHGFQPGDLLSIVTPRGTCRTRDTVCEQHLVRLGHSTLDLRSRPLPGLLVRPDVRNLPRI